jgi:hypothetical protein
MNKIVNTLCAGLISMISLTATAGNVTNRVPYFTNNQVSAWETIIYPSSRQQLKLHRHDNNRVLVAFTDGTLKVINDKGAIHYLKLKKQQVYFLEKDVPGEMHTDENVSGHPITLAVIEIL